MNILLILLTIYIVQLLVLLSIPYYFYRRSYKRHKDRTIGGFVEYTSYTMGDLYMPITLIPFAGTITVIIVLIEPLIQWIIKKIKFLYNKYIKNIKI